MGGQEDCMKLLFAVSEAVPFIKTGGLADVAGALPAALAKLGVDSRVILPKYRDIAPEWKARMEHVTDFSVAMGWRRQYCGLESLTHNGIIYYFVDNEFYFSRDAIYGEGQEEGERFGFFCRAVLESLPHIGFYPDVLHCNDWQTGMIPTLLKLQYMHLPSYSKIRTLFTIHNLKFQGVFDYKQLDEYFGLGLRYFTPEYLEFYGGISFMKGGLVFSDYISTVSPTYAHEIQSPYYGERLDGLLRERSGVLKGILNGIDKEIWNPETDPYIDTTYSLADFSGKERCKAALRNEFCLAQREDVAVAAIVSRLSEQKGLDLIEGVLHELLELPLQLIVVGQGEAHYHEMLTWAQWRFPGKVAVRFEHEEALAHRVYAGADIFLMPSRFEPCGLSQLISLRYGTIPLVRETGGLKDTVEPYNKYTDEGIGFSFANYNAHELLFTLERALGYFPERKLWSRMMRRAMEADFGWDLSAEQYLSLYGKMHSFSVETKPEHAPSAKPKAKAAPKKAKPKSAATSAKAYPKANVHKR